MTLIFPLMMVRFLGLGVAPSQSNGRRRTVAQQPEIWKRL